MSEIQVLFRRKFAFVGALLFSIGLLTGFWVAATATGAISIPKPHMALASHLNALLGGLWLLAISYSLEFVNYSELQVKRLFYLTVVSCYANWLITLVAGVLGVNGLNYSGDFNNNVVAFLLQILVVVPALAGSVYWIRGFLKEPLH